jgi:DNA modification methylase
MPKKLTWTTAKVKLGDLIEWDKNPVKISERDARELAKSIDKFDHVLPYVAAAPLNGKKAKSLPLLDGHQRKRVELTLRRGVTAETVVDVRVPSRALSEKERAEIAVRLRKNTGEFDDKKLLEWFEADDLLDWGFDKDELEDIGFEFEDNDGKDTEPQIERAEELLKKWKVKPGQLWELGEHRLICGDCTDSAVVARVMADECADLVLTDPPYSVNYGEKNRALNSIGRSNRIESDIEGDDLSTEETAERIWSPAFENAYNVSRNGTVIYCFAPQGGDQMMMMMMMKAKWNDRLHQLIWRKNAPTFSMGRLDYQYQHEPILYSWRGTNHGFYGKSARSVIDCDRPSASKLHPTMKPVALFETLLKNSSREGSVVYEPFNGSGTTLIACENLRRKCRAIELDPKYVAVTLERFHDHTGVLPKLVK